MIRSRPTAASGTAMLAISQAAYLVLGYVATVLLAREFGPAAYGVYAVVMSVLVSLEQSGRHAIPTATAKLLAEATTDRAVLERTAVALNLALHFVLFVLLWVAAPWLASLFAIANGAVLLRLAAIDLPVFGAYSAVRAIHQGRRGFLRLGLSQVVYALGKCLGVALVVVAGGSLEHALLVNVAATIVGLACVLPGIDWRWAGASRAPVAALLSAAGPMGLYYFLLDLRGSLALWTLQVMAHTTEQWTIGVYVAAATVARVPALLLTTVTLVIVPSLSRALALDDERWARRHITQALRFGAILYLPVALLVVADPETLLQRIYSAEFAGGGVLLALLVVGEGVRVAHAILGAVLTAAGQARQAAVVTLVSLAPSLALLVVLVHRWGAVGAAVASGAITLGSSLILARLVWKRFGAPMPARSVLNLALAAGLMTLGFALTSTAGAGFAVASAGALATYLIALILLQELTWRDLAGGIPWARTRTP